jgi:hypothetical protein
MVRDWLLAIVRDWLADDFRRPERWLGYLMLRDGWKKLARDFGYPHEHENRGGQYQRGTMHGALIMT